MYRLSAADVAAHRTATPLLGYSSLTPFPVFLDAAETAEVFSGNALTRTGAETVRLADAGEPVFGLAALDRNDVIDDLDGIEDVAPFAVWQGGPNAYLTVAAGPNNEVLADVAWAVGNPVYVQANGVLSNSNANSAVAIGEVHKVKDNGEIEIRLDAPNVNDTVA